MVFGALTGLAGSATAERRLGTDHGELRRELADLRRQARELDERIRLIEAELARDAPASAVTAGAFAVARPSDCSTLPFYRDSTGIKHLRTECLDPADHLSCDPPYTLDERGLRRFRPECLSAADGSDRRAGE